MAAPKVSLYSHSDLKTTLDDHLPIYLTSPNLLTSSGPALPKQLRFTQSHFHTYVRLALGYSAVAIAAYLFYLDWYLKVPFSIHKRIAAPSSLVYFALNGALQAWIWFAEKGIVFSGARKDGTTVTVRSSQPHRKYDPVYRLVVTLGGKGAPGQGKELELMAPFSRFFATDGSLVPAAFEGWLRESIPVLSSATSSGGKSAGTTSSTIAASNVQSMAAVETMDKVDEEDAVLVDSSFLEGAQASAREAGSAGKKRLRKKA